MVARRVSRPAPAETTNTGHITWARTDPACWAARELGLVWEGRPPTGPAYVVRHLGVDRGTFYLFASINERDSQYLAAGRDADKLRAAAEEHLASGAPDTRPIRAAPLPRQPAPSKPTKPPSGGFF